MQLLNIENGSWMPAHTAIVFTQLYAHFNYFKTRRWNEQQQQQQNLNKRVRERERNYICMASDRLMSFRQMNGSTPKLMWARAASLTIWFWIFGSQWQWIEMKWFNGFNMSISFCSTKMCTTVMDYSVNFHQFQFNTKKQRKKNKRKGGKGRRENEEKQKQQHSFFFEKQTNRFL